jgi:hypothetical protein
MQVPLEAAGGWCQPSEHSVRDIGILIRRLFKLDGKVLSANEIHCVVPIETVHFVGEGKGGRLMA